MYLGIIIVIAAVMLLFYLF